MSTNVTSDASGTESSLPTKFYAPAASATTERTSRVERFLTGLYERHRLFTRRLE